MSADSIGTIAAVVSAVVGIGAAMIAARSAAAAEKNAKLAGESAQRTAVTDLLGHCREILLENERVQSLCIDLRSEYISLFVFGGSPQGSRESTVNAALDKDSGRAVELSSEARAMASDPAKLNSASRVDLDQMSQRIGMAGVELRGIRESMERQLTETRAQNKMYQEKRVK